LKLFTLGTNDAQLYHNVPKVAFNALSVLDAIVVGTARNQRIGAQINLKEVDIRLLLNNKDNRPNVSYRVTLVAIPGVSSDTDNFAEQFENDSTIVPFNAPPLPGIARILYDKYVVGGNYSVTPLTSGGTAKERSFYVSARVPVNRVVQYATNNVATTRLLCWVNAYDAFGTLTTDNIASIPNCSIALYYTDE
jgi:hypothetical protein